MKKFEYSEPLNTEDRLVELEAKKSEEQGLPQFSKEVPYSVKRSRKGDRMAIDFAWRGSKSDRLKVANAEYLEDEFLPNFYRINCRDGADTVCTTHNSVAYVLRKTTKEIAVALLSACGKVRASLENVVGYLRTVLGNYYIISKIEKECWTFDSRLAKGDVKYAEADRLGSGHKKKLMEIIVETLADLHRRSMLLGGFTLNSVLLTGRGMKFADLRGMRRAEKRSETVDEFKNVMEYLFARGIATRHDVFYSVAVYMATNEKNCMDWHHEKTGRWASNDHIAAEIESGIVN